MRLFALAALLATALPLHAEVPAWTDEPTQLVRLIIKREHLVDMATVVEDKMLRCYQQVPAPLAVFAPAWSRLRFPQLSLACEPIAVALMV